jgi:hypothetical protein
LQIEDVRPEPSGRHQCWQVDQRPLIVAGDWGERQRTELQRRIHLAARQQLVQQRRRGGHHGGVGHKIDIAGFPAGGTRDQPVQEGDAKRPDFPALEVREGRDLRLRPDDEPVAVALEPVDRLDRIVGRNRSMKLPAAMSAAPDRNIVYCCPGAAKSTTSTWIPYCRIPLTYTGRELPLD